MARRDGPFYTSSYLQNNLDETEIISWTQIEQETLVKMIGELCGLQTKYHNIFASKYIVFKIYIDNSAIFWILAGGMGTEKLCWKGVENWTIEQEMISEKLS
jgi:hypothetical protein